MRETFREYMKLIRLPGLMGLAITPVAGALIVNTISFFPLFYLYIIGVISKIYGFVMNDYFDVELDKLSNDLSNRALVKGTISKRNALHIILACFLIGYLAIFVFFFRNHPYFYIGLFCIIIADILTITYNKYGKKLIGSDFFIALAESLFLLFGALMVLTNNPPGIFFWIIFVLLFNEQLYMNAIAGGLKDADHDPLMNVKNIALTSGVEVKKDKTLVIPSSFKIFGYGERIASAFLVFSPFIFFGFEYELWQIILLLFIIVVIFYENHKLLNIKKFERKRILKLIGIQLITWQFLVPFMLFLQLGWTGFFIIWGLPAFGFVFFSILTKEKILDTQM